MFIGHFALGFAAKKMEGAPSLGTTLMATQFIDLLWPVFLLSGLEKVSIEPGATATTPLDFVSYPYSHSLLAVVLWAVLFGGVYYALRKNKRGALLLAGLVVSHWVLDWVTHRPDLPLTFSEQAKVGLGLWNQKALALAVEGTLFAGGVYLYATSTHARNRWGRIALWSFVGLVGVIYAMNAIGDPPPSVEAIAYTGFAQWLFIAWGYWIDRHRGTAHWQHSPAVPSA